MTTRTEPVAQTLHVSELRELLRAVAPDGGG